MRARARAPRRRAARICCPGPPDKPQTSRAGRFRGRSPGPLRPAGPARWRAPRTLQSQRSPASRALAAPPPRTAAWDAGSSRQKHRIRAPWAPGTACPAGGGLPRGPRGPAAPPLAGSGREASSALYMRPKRYYAVMYGVESSYRSHSVGSQMRADKGPVERAPAARCSAKTSSTINGKAVCSIASRRERQGRGMDGGSRLGSVCQRGASERRVDAAGQGASLLKHGNLSCQTQLMFTPLALWAMAAQEAASGVGAASASCLLSKQYTHVCLDPASCIKNVCSFPD